MQEEPLRILIPADLIEQRVRELGTAISKDYADVQELLVIGVLNGAFIFTADLVRHLQLPCRIGFIRASSYGGKRTSSGRVKLELGQELELENRQVLLVEDIVDTGLTLSRITSELLKRKPASLRICTLLDKPAARQVPCRPDYTGFTIPDLFVVGYGLDADGRFRELPFIGIPET